MDAFAALAWGCCVIGPVVLQQPQARLPECAAVGQQRERKVDKALHGRSDARDRLELLGGVQHTLEDLPPCTSPTGR